MDITHAKGLDVCETCPGCSALDLSDGVGGVHTNTHTALSVKCDADWRVSNDNVMCGGPFETRAAVSVSARATWPAVTAEKTTCV